MFILWISQTSEKESQRSWGGEEGREWDREREEINIDKIKWREHSLFTLLLVSQSDTRILNF